jgi:protein-tyrosine phosphatase
MEDDNHSQLDRLAADAGDARRSRLVRMMAYAPRHGVREVPDPYYGSERDFERMCDLLDDATRGLLDEIRAGLGQGAQDGRDASS